MLAGDFPVYPRHVLSVNTKAIDVNDVEAGANPKVAELLASAMT